MPEHAFQTPARGSTGPRVAAVVVATVVGLLAVGLLAAGGLLLWGDGQKDHDGYLSTDGERFHTRGSAVTTDTLDVDLDAPGWVVERDRFGKVRLQATPKAGKPVFVGIARTRDVSAYLRGTPHASVTDLDYDPFSVDYRVHAGDRRPAPPGRHDIWAASAQGAGTQTMKWKVRDGSWSIVVMNADGSRGVDAGVSVGASVPFLAPLGWSALGAGLLMLAVAGAAAFVGLRTPRERPRFSATPAGVAG